MQLLICRACLHEAFLFILATIVSCIDFCTNKIRPGSLSPGKKKTALTIRHQNLKWQLFECHKIKGIRVPLKHSIVLYSRTCIPKFDDTSKKCKQLLQVVCTSFKICKICMVGMHSIGMSVSWSRLDLMKRYHL